jgi:ribosomal protein S12 methylthiotransferase accessory factor
MQPYTVMGADALSPPSLTLYDADQYASSDFSYKPLDSGTPIGWTTGYSLTRKRPVLVPAFAVYQPYRSEAGEHPVIQQITTGLACGNTLEEAILSAICEVVERDAAMLMWLQRRRPPRVVVDGGAGGIVAETLRRFRSRSNHVVLLDVTTDFGIPAYVAAWRGPICGHFGSVFASCAKLSPARAAVGALTELAQCLMWASSLLDAGERLPDPMRDAMSRIEDHVLWPLRADAEAACGFIFSSPRWVGLDEHADAGSEDVLGSIEACIARIAAQGLEVIVVDVTSPDIRECGLHVVRAIIPGAQPLFFGTGLHRVSERARVGGVPGGSDGSLNLHPHPFP